MNELNTNELLNVMKWNELTLHVAVADSVAVALALGLRVNEFIDETHLITNTKIWNDNPVLVAVVDESDYLFYDVTGGAADDFVEVGRVERLIRQPETHVVHALRILAHSLTK